MNQPSHPSNGRTERPLDYIYREILDFPPEDRSRLIARLLRVTPMTLILGSSTSKSPNKCTEIRILSKSDATAILGTIVGESEEP